MELTQLWLPIVLSAVFVFLASSIIWMALPYHKADIKVLPDEKALTEPLAKLDLPPGTYMWPNCGSGESQNSPEFKARWDVGPWGSINILGCKPNFGANLGLVFVFYLVVGVCVAYITSQSQAAGAECASVFQVACATAILAYCAGGIAGAFFMGKPKRFMFTDFIDGVVYGLITAATFAWLWPAA